MNRLSFSALWLSLALSNATAIRPLGGLTLGDLFFILALVLSLPDLPKLALNCSSRTSGVYFAGALLIVAASLLSGWDIARPEDIFLYALKIGFTFLLYIPMLSWMALDEPLIEKLKTAWVYSGAFAGASAIIQYRNGGSLLGAEAIWGRMTGLTEHPNELGLVTAIILPIALQKLLFERGIFRTSINTGLLALNTCGLMLSVSMTGLICGLVALGLSLALAIARKETRKLALAGIFALIILAIPLGYLLRDTLEDFRQRIEFTTGGEKINTVETRLMGLQELVFEGDGVRLTGRGVYAAVDSEGKTAHNMYLRAAVELGLIGMFGLFIVTLRTGWIAIKEVWMQRGARREYWSGLLVSYLVFLLGSQAGPVMMQRDLWVPAMFILAGAHLFRPQKNLGFPARSKTDATSRSPHPNDRTAQFRKQQA